MQLISVRRCWVTAIALLTLLLLQGGTGANASSDKTDLTNLVSGLYKKYAWVVIFSPSPLTDTAPLAQASRKELQEFFVPDLAKAIWDDTQCMDKRQEICALNFDILFDSQDPSASGLTVQAGGEESEVLVCFEVYSDYRKCLFFIGERVNGEFLIYDIRYPEQPSLRKLLGLVNE